MRQQSILFLDNMAIAHQEGLQRVAGATVKHPDNPVLQPSYPWEGDNAYIFGSVIQEPGTGQFGPIQTLLS